jgi:hypothetical protein
MVPLRSSHFSRPAEKIGWFRSAPVIFPDPQKKLDVPLIFPYPQKKLDGSAPLQSFFPTRGKNWMIRSAPLIFPDPQKKLKCFF